MEVGIEDCLHIEFEYNQAKCVHVWDAYSTVHGTQRGGAAHAVFAACAARLCAFRVARYHLKDVVTGKIFFLLVRIKIKHMELAIIRRESAGTGTRHTPSHCLSGGARPSRHC